jgi:hypothetical protein
MKCKLDSRETLLQGNNTVLNDRVSERISVLSHFIYTGFHID